MARIDLNAARAARQEAQPEPNIAVLGGHEFTLPSSAPAAFLVALGRLQKGDLSSLEDALASLFTDGQLEEALRLGLGLEDLEPILNLVYGISLGEAPASG